MRRIEFSRRLEEASGGVRGELLNRGSGVRVPATAPKSNSESAPSARQGQQRIANVQPSAACSMRSGGREEAKRHPCGRRLNSMSSGFSDRCPA